MGVDTMNDPILTRFRARLDAVYAGRLDRVILFGSRARGDHRPDSDYDVAVFIRDPQSPWDELAHLSYIAGDILMDTGAYVSAKPFPASDYSADRPLMVEIRRDGLQL